MLQNINEELLIFLNSLMNYIIIEKLVLFFSDTPIFFLPIFLVYYWIYYTYNKKYLLNEKSIIKKEKLLLIFYSTIIWIIINLIIKNFIHFERPEKALEWVWKLILNHIPDASFPSDHATVSVAFLISLFFAWYKKIWLFFISFVILMIISRVIIWVHWPFDIVVWTVIWIFSSYITFKYLAKINIVNKINKNIIKLTKYIKL